MKPGLFFVLSFTLSASAIANCYNVDIRDVNPELRTHFTIPRSQANLGWCYGFAAADLLTAEMKIPVSSAHVSTIYNSDIAANPLAKIFQGKSQFGAYEGGFTRSAIKQTVRIGSVCAEEDMPYDKQFWGQTSQMISQLNVLKVQLKEKQVADDVALRNLERIMPRSVFPQIDHYEIMEQLKKGSLNKMLDNIMATTCGNKLVAVPEIRVKRYPKKDKQSYLSYLNNSLEKGKPVAVYYDVKHVTPNPGRHASVVIARRSRSGSCEYKIRNSWGKTCQYLPEIECNKEEGSFWVNEELFLKMSTDLVFVE